MEKYIVFGSGEYGHRILRLLDSEQIDFYIDNNPKKQNQKIKEFRIYSLEDATRYMDGKTIIVAVSEKYEKEIISQLLGKGITRYKTFQEIQCEITRNRIESRTDYIGIYNKAITWIINNTIDNQSIICNSEKRKGYPEVTGYYIPSLLRWGYRDLAISYAKWLCQIQKKDGSWYDTDNRAAYVFDSAQILKGLLAVSDILPEVDSHIIKGCEWIISNIEESGRLTTPTKEAWGTDRSCSELIHLYCLSPLREAGEKYDKEVYIKSADRVLNYYKINYYNEIMNFTFLSHFYAYVMEALLDLGEVEIAKEAMEKISSLQKGNGAVPAYYDVDWVCSTGLFQFALVWFRLGEIEKANKAFTYACKLQNESGGWFGSYLSETNANEENNYFPTGEISWANKYFLDALYYKNLAEFDLCADSFADTIDKDDERYQVVKNIVDKGENQKILDVGCGKGRYIKNLLEDCPKNQYYAVDISERVMEKMISKGIKVKQGTLTNIPYEERCFDVTYACEALEHAIDLNSAIREMARVTRAHGIMIVIDKNRGSLGALEIGEWEQWPDEQMLRALMLDYCSDVEIIHGLHYENKRDSELFSAWIGEVR